MFSLKTDITRHSLEVKNLCRRPPTPHGMSSSARFVRTVVAVDCSAAKQKQAQTGHNSQAAPKSENKVLGRREGKGSGRGVGQV